MVTQKQVVSKTIKPALDFIKNILPEDKVLIVYGHDNDTICSAIVMQRILKKFYSNSAKLFITDDNFAVNDEDTEGIEKENPDYIIIVDIAHLASEHVEKTLAKRKTLIIDHHQPLKLKNISYSNPREFDKKIYMPVSYITYKMYEKLGDASGISWISGVGVLSDHAVKSSEDLFDLIDKTYPRLIAGTELNEDDLFKYSRIGMIAKILDSARIVKGKDGAVLAAKVMSEADSPRYIMKSGNDDSVKLISYSDIVRKEFKKIVTDFNKKRKMIKGNIIYYEIPSKLSIKSSLSGYLVQFYKDKILVIAQKRGENLDVSFRRGDNVKTDLNKLAKKATRGIPDANGGGHEAASGGRIPMKYISKFLTQL